MNELEPLIQGGIVGSGALALLWALYSKMRALHASDKASVGRSEAETTLYENLREQINSASNTEKELRSQMNAVRSEFEDLKNRCDSERLEAFKSIDELSGRVDTLTASVNECQARHERREEEDEKGRRGEVERRKAGQPPRGRRAPKA